MRLGAERAFRVKPRGTQSILPVGACRVQGSPGESFRGFSSLRRTGPGRTLLPKEIHFMKPGKNRKTSPKLQETVNNGPEKNARVQRTGNPSGLENMSLPKGRGGSGSMDSAETEKQNQ